MCGIAGCINIKFPKNNLAALIREALEVNSLRGENGAGIFLVDKDKAVHTFKKPMAGFDFVQLDRTNMIVSLNDPRFIVTHNRASNSGLHNSLHHTHPIEYEHILLVHNGTLSSTHNLDVSNVSHDSSAIAESIAKHGAETTLKNLNGSFALVWYDTKEETLNLARNSERPLYLANIKDGMGMLFASESGMLSWLAERNDIKLKSIFSLKENTHIRVPFDLKQKHETFTFIPYKPSYISHTGTYAMGTYTLVASGEEFIARYIGEIVFADKMRSHKFTHQKDSMYGWLAPSTMENKKEYKIGTHYKIKAIEARVYNRDSSNKQCEVIGKADIQIIIENTFVKSANKSLKDIKAQYKDESIVTFEIQDMAQLEQKAALWNIQGVTADSAEVVVRAFNVKEDLIESTEEYYTAKIRTVIQSGSTEEVYILVYPDTIKGFTYNAEHPGPLYCGWCDLELTHKELISNRCSELGPDARLCDNCIPYRDSRENAERIL